MDVDIAVKSALVALAPLCCDFHMGTPFSHVRGRFCSASAALVVDTWCDTGLKPHARCPCFVPLNRASPTTVASPKVIAVDGQSEKHQPRCREETKEAFCQYFEHLLCQLGGCLCPIYPYAHGLRDTMGEGRGPVTLVSRN